MSELAERVYYMEYKQKLKDKEQEKRLKEIEKIQRKKEEKEEQKQYEKDLLFACKKELQARFEQDFALQGTQAKYNFYNIRTRDSIIKSIAKSETQGEYLETNYNKILNEIIKKYELHEKYIAQLPDNSAQNYYIEKIPEWEKEQRKRERKKNIIAVLQIIGIIIKWIFIIAFGAIFILLKFIAKLADK